VPELDALGLLTVFAMVLGDIASKITGRKYLNLNFDFLYL
jgi:hypothetical protein